MICERCGAVFCFDGDSFPECPEDSRKRFCGTPCRKAYGHARRGWKRLPRCPRNGKASHRSKAEAEIAMRDLAAAGRGPLHPYRCPDCRHWHLTSMITTSALGADPARGGRSIALQDVSGGDGDGLPAADDTDVRLVLAGGQCPGGR